MKDLVLVPRPKRVRAGEGTLAVPSGVTPVGCSLKGESLSFALGPHLRENGVPVLFRAAELGHEEYELNICESGAEIAFGDDAGAFYALLTLRQLLDRGEGKLPFAEISDAPDFPVRGVMVDISRNRIPTNETIFRLIDWVASLKLNQFQLYIEGKSYYYPSLGEFYREGERDILTAEDVKAIDAYCCARFVEFVPNQNCFGHMSEWLAEDKLRPLAECPNGSFRYGGVTTPSSTLAPLEEGSLRLVQAQLSDLLPPFSSEKVNIGGDEPFELGEGVSREICEREGKAKVYLDFMEKIFRTVREGGRRPMMWGDVFKEYSAEYGDRFPKDVILLEWGYSADSFTEELCEMYRRTGLDYYLCPGTSLWNTVTGKTDVMRANVKSAARLGKKYGAAGILLTDWGDGGTCQPFACALLPYATGAAYAWNSACEQDGDIERFLDFAVGDGSGAFASVLADLGRYYLCADRDDFNATKIFKTLYVQQTDCMNVDEGNFEPLFCNRDFVRPSAAECARTRTFLEGIEARLNGVAANGTNELLLRETRWAIGYLRHGCILGEIKADERQISRAELEVLLRDILRLNGEYEAIWKLRARRTGLDRSMMRMRALARKYAAILG